MIKEVKGDLLTYPGLEVICHQTNCFGAFGKGLALSIRKKYPGVFERYKNLCKNTFVKSSLLGTIQVVPTDDGKLIANIFGQFMWCESNAPYSDNHKSRFTDYDALQIGLHKLHTWMTENDKHIVGCPDLIGCGLAGGSKEIVRQIIDDEFGSDDNITFYIVTYKN